MRIDVTTPSGEPAGELTITPAGLRTGFSYKSDTLFPPSRLVLQFTEGIFPVGIPLPKNGGMALERKMSPLQIGGHDLSAPVKALLVPLSDPPVSPLEPPSVTTDLEQKIEKADPEPPEPAPEPAPELTPEPIPEAAPEAASEPATEPTPEVASEPASDWVPEPDPARFFTDPDLIESARKITGALSKYDGDTLLAFPFSPSMPFPMLPAFRFGSAEEINGASYLVFRVRDGAPM